MSRSENSGLIDMAALMREAEKAEQAEKARTSSPNVALPAPPTPLPATVRAVPQPQPTPTPAPTPRPKATESLDGIAAVSPPAYEELLDTDAATPRAKKSPPRSRKGAAFTAAALCLAAAAAFVLYQRDRSAPAPIKIASAPTAAVVAPRPAQTAQTERAPEPGGVDLNALPAATAVTTTPPAPIAINVPAAAAAAKPAATTLALPVTEGEPGDLGDAMRSKAGSMGTKEDTAPSESSRNARQVRPSPGAVLGAINAALPAARACLGEDDPIRSGTIVFRSDGSVARVDLDGSRPVDPCVKGALMKARVEPFLDDSFTTRLTVRP